MRKSFKVKIEMQDRQHQLEMDRIRMNHESSLRDLQLKYHLERMNRTMEVSK